MRTKVTIMDKHSQTDYMQDYLTVRWLDESSPARSTIIVHHSPVTRSVKVKQTRRRTRRMRRLLTRVLDAYGAAYSPSAPWVG